ncbi:hypothetical protein GY45DRAFT_63507 [Cubamyces sp. BRFM 1775]|nr:hypothetical protein GY45DRAFT_63507 [Cubamyces sp. BRFM 1775]
MNSAMLGLTPSPSLSRRCFASRFCAAFAPEVLVHAQDHGGPCPCRAVPVGQVRRVSLTRELVLRHIHLIIRLGLHPAMATTRTRYAPCFPGCDRWA